MIQGILVLNPFAKNSDFYMTTFKAGSLKFDSLATALH